VVLQRLRTLSLQVRWRASARCVYRREAI
jgi:hypothetical protein